MRSHALRQTQSISSTPDLRRSPLPCTAGAGAKLRNDPLHRRYQPDEWSCAYSGDRVRGPGATSTLDDRVIPTLQLTASEVAFGQAVSESVDLLGLPGRTVIGDEHRHPGKWHRKHDERQRKPPGLIKDAGQRQAWDAGRHEDRVLAPTRRVLLGVGGFRRRDENGIGSPTAVFPLVPAALTSRFDTLNLLLPYSGSRRKFLFAKQPPRPGVRKATQISMPTRPMTSVRQSW